mmetsp:Transcript_13595/g.43871  ORF Transcript_13595/g.43871 Transcript_13595/m.43871 type:complete len:216 (-) Transcript_13595:535-1182(-)
MGSVSAAAALSVRRQPATSAAADSASTDSSPAATDARNPSAWTTSMSSPGRRGRPANFTRALWVATETTASATPASSPSAFSRGMDACMSSAASKMAWRRPSFFAAASGAAPRFNVSPTRSRSGTPAHVAVLAAPQPQAVPDVVPYWFMWPRRLPLHCIVAVTSVRGNLDFRSPTASDVPRSGDDASASATSWASPFKRGTGWWFRTYQRSLGVR